MEPPWGAGAGANVTASRLVRKLHRVPRYTWEFRPVEFQEPPFQPDVLLYDEAIAVIAGVVAIAGVLLSSGCAIWLCRQRCRDRRGTAAVDMNIRRSRAVLIVLGLLSLAGFGVLIVGTIMLRSTVAAMNAKVDAASAHYQTIQAGGDAMVRALGSTELLIRRLNATGNGTEIKAELLAATNGSLHNVTAFVAGRLSSNFNSTTLDRYVSTWTDYFAYGSIGFTVLLLSPILVVLAGLCTRNAMMMRAAGSAFAGFILVAIAVGGAEFAVSVAVSDFCMEPNAATAFYMKKYVEDRDADVVDYYVHCPPEATSPLSPYFVDARAWLAKSNTSWSKLDDCACFGGNADLMGQIFLQLSGVDQALVAVQSEANCSSFHAQYTATVDDACSSGIVAITMLFTGHLAVGLLFGIMIPLLARLWPVYSKMVSYASIQSSPSQSWFNQAQRSGRESTQPMTAQQWFERQNSVTERLDTANTADDDGNGTGVDPGGGGGGGGGRGGSAAAVDRQSRQARYRDLFGTPPEVGPPPPPPYTHTLSERSEVGTFSNI